MRGLSTDRLRAPDVPDSFVRVAPDSTGKMLRTREHTVGANAVHSQYVVPGSDRTRTGLYRVHSGILSVTAAADAAAPGGAKLWLVNQPTSTVAVALRRIRFESVHSTALVAVSSPRITYDRFTTTTASTATPIAPGRRVRTAVAGLAADAANQARVVTASTGMTMAAGETLGAFYVLQSLTAAGAVTPSLEDRTAPDPDAEIILAAGEGILFRQPDAGVASDTRKYNIDLVWEEFTAP